MWRSYLKEINPVKKGLYWKLGALYTLFMAGLPCVVFLQLAVDPWVRDKFTATASFLITTAAYAVM